MSDYERIAKAISFINGSVRKQPTLDKISAHLNMSPYHFQRMFSRWVGVTPKKYLQILTVERAKLLLSESKPLLEVSDSLGLSSGSRLYDHFINLEAVTPGEFKKQGGGVKITYGVHITPFGYVFIALTPRGICKFSFIDSEGGVSHLDDLIKKWPLAEMHEDYKSTFKVVQSIFSNEAELNRPLSLHVVGTNFQVSVWRALLQIPLGDVVSYGQVAESIGKPNSSRAVGTAVGANPIAFVIPCHRVIQQSGKLGGYRWGETRKHAIHAWETVRHEK